MTDSTTFEILAEQVIILESGGDQSNDSEIEVEDVVYLLKQSSAEIVSSGFLKNNTFDTPFQFVQEYAGLQVKKDTELDSLYVEMPGKPVALSMNRGVREVYPNGNPENSYIPIEPGSLSLIKSTLSGEVGFVPTNTRINFYNLKHRPKSVTVVLTQSNPKDIGNSDEFHMPIEFQLQIIERVRKIINSRSQSDDTNNSIDNRA